MHAPPPLSRRSVFLRFALIAFVLLVIVLAFGYVGSWLAPQRLTAQRMVNQLQANAGVFPGYRRNHAKGVCVAGYFDSNGQAQTYSVAQVFSPGRTPVVGRFAVPVGNPYAPDSSAPIRSLALRFAQANGQQWRTGMNSMPVFPVATPQAFYELLQAQQPDPSTGKPNPAKVGAFFAAHPETAAFLAWVKTAKPSASYVTNSYWSLNAFEFIDANGEKHAVRWRMVPEASGDAVGGSDANYLDADLAQRLAQGPQRWHLMVTLANPGDPTDDASKEWPSDRREIDAGTLVLTSTQPQESGECRDINYDPTVLPHGIEISDDPLLPARSAAYATSYLRRTSEEAHLPGTAAATTKPETK
ncbi:catalase family peroxidase [Dyella nitratireducens]|uniref:Catalase-related peroxidase n=1 Tax=Dyella nitratireducens TaxID=1849580 RepID=A0ABQ1GXI5_9GAMM|nr:catalase family peroxidase [Dyella nitratireducens]GGA51912.1 catalase-related peroxidase [Dyella nitratireducens]GLQ41640.1 catalase-related peroxidase [Dyella nitratireducens]